eukprot:TRINITY_DN7245_c0_g2_i2.p2 TRINITY_DN7245_c0_g2~~TRINITY_DN7245_c0_g2_i2.p2  ORF type:complete len:156 (-),score=34.08 TRINITY_DN7245_c0_g2_i2:12-413(-)
MSGIAKALMRWITPDREAQEKLCEQIYHENVETAEKLKHLWKITDMSVHTNGRYGQATPTEIRNRERLSHVNVYDAYLLEKRGYLKSVNGNFVLTKPPPQTPQDLIAPPKKCKLKSTIHCNEKKKKKKKSTLR